MLYIFYFWYYQELIQRFIKSFLGAEIHSVDKFGKSPFD